LYVCKSVTASSSVEAFHDKFVDDVVVPEVKLVGEVLFH
jgi:hypothetical protein